MTYYVFIYKDLTNLMTSKLENLHNFFLYFQCILHLNKEICNYKNFKYRNVSLIICEFLCN